MRTARLLFLLVILAITPMAYARGTSAASKCTGCARNSKGKIARSAKAKRDFQKTHPCPATGAPRPAAARAMLWITSFP